jgi:hypothetical protein
VQETERDNRPGDRKTNNQPGAEGDHQQHTEIGTASRQKEMFGKKQKEIINKGQKEIISQEQKEIIS